MPRPQEHTSAEQELSPAEAEAIAECMRAFATASRVRILFALVSGSLTVERLADRIGLEANAVSQQLRVLRHLRLVTADRKGRHIHYRLHNHHVVDLLAAIRHSREHVELGWSSGPETPTDSERAT